MGAAGLIDIKRRIKSIKSTKKITNAMGLVATSKLRKCRKELLVNQKFVDSLDEIIKTLSNVYSDERSVYFTRNNSKDKLYIVITSETGLCGGFNGNVVSYLESITYNEANNTKVIVVGKKGISYVRRTGLETVAEYVDISDVPTVKDSNTIFEKALKMYSDGEVSEINVVYCDYISPVKQEPACLKILPIEEYDSIGKDVHIEPDVITVLNDSVKIYLKGKIRNILLNSKCSEQSSRMTAMDGATQNANDLLDSLNLKFNRIRQGIITQEISEIVGGAEAQK